MRLEFWADSFHEGDWFCEHILRYAAGTQVANYAHKGVIPVYRTEIEGREVELVVYGGYSNWDHLPQKIAEQIAWGKPDLIVFDPDDEQILFAVEETAAVPTGNQALQRCERMHAAAARGVPFWYLLSRFGIHLDQGIRQASPWPALMGLCLSAATLVPSVVLTYSSVESPEDYEAGAGAESLFRVLAQIIRNHAAGRRHLEGTVEPLTDQFVEMTSYIRETYKSVTDYFPAAELMGTRAFSERLAVALCAEEKGEALSFLDWPRTEQLPKAFRQRQRICTANKADDLIAGLERSKAEELVYTLSPNAGSRPQPPDDVYSWLAQQRRIHSTAPKVQPPAPFGIDINDFPASQSGNLHINCCPSTLYLVDSANAVWDLMQAAYPRLSAASFFGDESPALVYVSSSLKPGRIFGDPYTGQFAAFSWIFGGTLERRIRFAYFPHQSHGVFSRTASGNKGKRLFLEAADYLVFMGGVVYDIRGNEWL